MSTYTAIIPGPAVTQGSKRIGRVGGDGKPILFDDNRRLKPWREKALPILRQAGPPEPLDCAVSVTVVVGQARPKAHYGVGRNTERLKRSAPRGWPKTGLDLDKVGRAVGDVLKLAGWVTDDARIAEWHIWRLWTREEHEQVQVTLRESE